MYLHCLNSIVLLVSHLELSYLSQCMILRSVMMSQHLWRFWGLFCINQKQMVLITLTGIYFRAYLMHITHNICSLWNITHQYLHGYIPDIGKCQGKDTITTQHMITPSTVYIFCEMYEPWCSEIIHINNCVWKRSFNLCRWIFFLHDGDIKSIHSQCVTFCAKNCCLFNKQYCTYSSS